MIYLLTGKLGTGVYDYEHAFQNAGIQNITAYVTDYDKPMPDIDGPKYAHVLPSGIPEIVQKRPDIQFHIVYINAETDDERRAYFNNHNPGANDFDTVEAGMVHRYEQFEQFTADMNNTPKNLRAIHTINTNYDETTIKEWAAYFVDFHTTLIRLMKLVELGIKYNLIRANEDGYIYVEYEYAGDDKPRIEFVNQERFADILAVDNAGLAMLVRDLLPKLTNEDLKDFCV